MDFLQPDRTIARIEIKQKPRSSQGENDGTHATIISLYQRPDV